MWLLVKDFINVQGFATTERGCRKILDKMAKSSPNIRRKRTGTKAFEYDLAQFNDEVQAQIRLRYIKSIKQKSEVVPNYEQTYLSTALWQPYEKASQVQKEKAQKKCQAVIAVTDLTDIGTPLQEALSIIAESHNVSVGSLKNWVYKTKGIERHDWLAVLLTRSGTNRTVQYAEIEPEAWDVFLADYLRPEKPTLAACFLRLTQSAREMGWAIPSQHSIERKLKREVPREVQVYLRQGENALFQLYPAMRRSVADLQAMEWLNGDGYQHNVFVRWYNGEIIRPKTWLWQDVRTRRILGYRCDMSENSDSIRYALMDVIEKYGIPREITIDNTRAAANKWLTGGVPNRYRFKVKQDDPIGIIPMLGIKLHWTSVIAGKGHGQAKPIERAFSHGGLGELVDKHPKLADYYAGANVLDKPDNYNQGKAGIEIEVFLQVLEEGIAMWNAREKRQGELTQGLFSYDDIWQRDYAKANIRRATPEQIKQLMLMSEACRVNHKGEFTLEAGGKLFGRTNVYWAQALLGYNKQKIVVRFDPEKLHENVQVYSLDGKFICEAICSLNAGFGDKSVAREHGKHRKQFAKAVKAQAKALELMEAQEAAQFLPNVEEETPIAPASIEYYITEGSSARQAIALIEQEEEESTFESLFQKGVEKLKAEQG